MPEVSEVSSRQAVDDTFKAFPSFKPKHDVVVNLPSGLQPEDQAALLNNAAFQLTERWQKTQDIDDLENAIIIQMKAAGIVPSHHPNRAGVFDNLANALVRHFELSKDGQVIQAAIFFFRQAQESLGENNPTFWTIIDNLAGALLNWAELVSDEQAVAEAISIRKRIVDAAPLGNPRRLHALFRLVIAYESANSITGNQDAIDEGIRVSQDLLSIAPSEHPHLATMFFNLAKLYRSRYQWSGDPVDIMQSVQVHRRALTLLPRQAPMRPRVLSNLVTALLDQFAFTDDDAILDEGLRAIREALELIPDNTAARANVVNNFVTVLLTRHRQTGDIHSSDEAINLSTNMLETLPPHNDSRPALLSGLGSALGAKFLQSGDEALGRRAIEVQKESASLNMDASDRVYALGNLGIAFINFYHRVGDVTYLEEAIRVNRTALEMSPERSLDYVIALNNLAHALQDRYLQSGHEDSLDEATQKYEEGLLLGPEKHAYRALLLNNFSAILHQRFTQLHDEDALIRAVKVQREALELFPSRHLQRHYALGNLGVMLEQLYDVTKDVDLLNESIIHLQEAVNALDSTNSARFVYLRELATSYRTKAKQEHDWDLLAVASAYCEEAIANAPHDAPKTFEAYHTLAELHLTRDTPIFDFSAALEELTSALSYPHGIPRDRLRLARRSLSIAESAYLSSDDAEGIHRMVLLSIYDDAIQLIPRVANFGLNASARLRELASSEELAINAAVHAIVMEKPESAVELLEQGRAVFWSQSLNLRDTSLDKVSVMMADELRYLFRVLENEALPTSLPRATPIEEELNTQRRRAGTRAEEIIDHIRTLPGHERYLRGATFSELSRVAVKGFVVILFAASAGSYAIIIKSEGTLAVPLPDAVPDELQNIGQRLRSEDVRHSREGDVLSENLERLNLGVSLKPSKSDLMDKELGLIWISVVRPIIRALGLQKRSGRERPRLHWCPVGLFTFLPLHAAGIYGQVQDCCSDYVVSSYTPTLDALLRARSKEVSLENDKPTSVLLVAEPSAPGLPVLSSVKKEVRVVEEALSSSQISYIGSRDPHETSSGSVMGDVLDALPTADVLHLACHGQQHPVNPLLSGFKLRDGTLTVAEIMKLNLPHAQFAFLSACETAKGDKTQPDQTVHLAATMLFVGFRSVIGTMWSMGDADGPLVAHKIYQAISGNGNALDLDAVPYALDDAVVELRGRGLSAEHWATFIHLGA